MRRNVDINDLSPSPDSVEGETVPPKADKDRNTVLVNHGDASSVPLICDLTYGR